MTEERVIHIIQHCKPGGIEQLVFSMLCADVENVYVLALEGSQDESIQYWPKLTHFRDNLFFANKKNGFSIKTVRFIKDICNSLGISVIHTHHIGPLIYGSLASRGLPTIKHIHTEHDIWHLQKFKDWLIETILFKVEKTIRVVAISKHIYACLKSYFPKLSVSLIYNGVDTLLFIPGNQAMAREYFKLPLSATIIGSAGRLETIKGHAYLIEAMQYLPSNFYLVIAGAGRLYETLLSQIHNLKLADRVCLLGHVENMSLFYQAGDIFCLPSLNEGMPLALLEAQACNVPVVCSDVGSCSEAVDPETGFLVAAKNPVAISNACLRIEERSGNPREFVLNNFSFDVLLNHYRQLYTPPTRFNPPP